jgi:SAM-dependent MidA family methyltransferase
VTFEEYLRRKIQEQGPIPFSAYMDEVLRHYYSTERNRIGFEGDFYTSADLDPVFGELLARQFQKWEEELGTFTVVELGAGKGLLARDILRHRQFPYMILERSPAMRRRQQELLRQYDITWIDELPAGLTGCIFSNEFFDALPVHRVVKRDGTLREIYVDEDFEEVEGELQFPIEAPIAERQITEVNLEARQWMRRIATALRSGYHLAIDYGYLRQEFFAQPRGTLMCYWQHQAVENPYVRVGDQDITAHVNFSDLMEEPGLRTILFTTQMEYLIRLGILEAIEKLAETGDAASMQRLIRIKKLILPESMGERFKVLVQTKE